MTDIAKKATQIAIIVIGFALAVTITAFNLSSSKDTSLYKGNLWIKCTNENCSAEYQISADEWRKLMPGPGANENTPFRCKKCGQATACLAEKCEECGAVFIPAFESRYYEQVMRCPNCGHCNYQEPNQ
ncbi:MAG: hypothetical protein ABIG61_00495 [Planctomycetota bacterium]